jgi:hypothetical protein
MAHGRGGLVARALVDGLDQATRIGRIIFVATPIAGTSLARESAFGPAADLLINALHLDDTGQYGRLAALLARLALPAETRRLLADIPGLEAQRRTTRLDWKQPRSIRCAAIAATYDPAPADALLRRVLSTNGADDEPVTAASAIFPHRHDFVVDAASANGFDPASMLLIDPNPNPTSTSTRARNGATIVRMAGVHHTNLLSPARVQAFLRAQLWDAD